MKKYVRGVTRDWLLLVSVLCAVIAYVQVSYGSNCAYGEEKVTCSCSKCTTKECPENMRSGKCSSCSTTTAKCDRLFGTKCPNGTCGNCCTHQIGSLLVCKHSQCNVQKVSGGFCPECGIAQSEGNNSPCRVCGSN